MPKFKNVGSHDVDAFRPAGDRESRFVAVGEVVEVPGVLVTKRPEPKKDEPAPAPLPADAYTVEHDGEERLWPKALWELVEDKPAAKPASVKEN